MIKRVQESPVIFEDKAVIGRRLYESDKLEYVHLNLDPGCSMESHTLPIDVDFFVISGEGNIKINKIKHHIREGDLLRVNKNTKRALFTNDNQHMKVLVIKVLK